ncbi:MAG: DUF748 domain-containing protein, partial [Parahaliea sp.]
QYQRDLDMELALFNPFALSLEVRRASLSETNDGGDFASLDLAEVNLSLAGLWRKGWVLDRLAVEGITVHLHRLASGELNIADFLQPGPEEPETDAPPPGVTVRDISLSSHRIRVTDDTRPDSYSTHWDDLKLQVSNLSTVVEEGRPYQLQLADESGGSLGWTGEVSIPGGYSRGHIALSGISLRPFWRFIRDQVDFELADGQLQADLDYQVDWKDGLSYRVDQGSLGVKALSLAPVDRARLSDTGIELADFAISGISVDGDGQSVRIDRVDVDGLALRGWLEGEQVSLADMFRTRFGSATQGDSPAADDSEPGQPWRVQLGSAAVNAADIRFRSPFTDPGTARVTPLNIEVKDIQWPVTGPSEVQVDLAINDQASLRIGGALQLQAGDGSLTFELADLPLALFGPNIPEVLNARINSGTARGKGELSLAGFGPATVTMDGAVDQLAITLYGDEDALTGWQQLGWKKLAVNLGERRLDLAELHLDGYTGRVHIGEDGQLNLQRLLKEDAARQAGETEQQASTDDAAATAATQTLEAPAAPWQVSVPTILISDSEVDYTDRSLPIGFRTVIGDVNGEISGLSSDPQQAMAVDIKGSVDGYAPVTLAGSASPLRTPPALDLRLTFQGVDLARLTPYSGTYAGYAIDRGTLNLDLKYSLAESRLQGDNKVVVQQLKLGDKVESEKAINVPLELGLALLTDANGVIDLAVPVSGNVNDPKFGLGSVIMGAFVNLITKAVTAPFSLLANLVGSEDDLQRINYPAGKTTADEVTRGKLLELAQALKQRPQLKLAIAGRLNPDSDRDKLQQQLLRESLLAEGLSEADIDDRSEAWAEAIAERYAQLPDAAASKEAGEDAPSPAVQSRRVREQIAVPADRLKHLADERAADAKRLLVNEGGLPADRAVIAQTDPQDEANTFSGVEMSVDS